MARGPSWAPMYSNAEPEWGRWARRRYRGGGRWGGRGYAIFPLIFSLWAFSFVLPMLLPMLMMDLALALVIGAPIAAIACCLGWPGVNRLRGGSRVEAVEPSQLLALEAEVETLRRERRQLQEMVRWHEELLRQTGAPQTSPPAPAVTL